MFRLSTPNDDFVRIKFGLSIRSKAVARWNEIAPNFRLLAPLVQLYDIEQSPTTTYFSIQASHFSYLKRVMKRKYV